MFSVRLALTLLHISVGNTFVVGSSSTCEAGWLAFEGGCYFFSRDSAQWLEAYTFCNLQGGYLAEPQTIPQQSFLRSESQRRFKDDPNDPANGGVPPAEAAGFWIGGTDIIREGHWQWIHNHINIETTDWYPGEPNSYHGNTEDCVLLNFQNNGHWVDIGCSEKHTFICEKRPSTTILIGR